MSVTSLPPPPMIAGAVPVLGHARKFFKDPIGLLRRGHVEKGNVFSLRLANRKVVIVLGPENNHFFFRETDRLLSIREGYPFFVKMFSKEFYFFAEFEEYMKQREVVMPRFTGDQLRGYVSIISEETVRLMQSMGDQGEFDLIPTLGPLVMTIAAHSFLGEDFRNRLGQQFFADFRDFSGGMETVLPLWLPIPRFLRSRRAKRKLHGVLGQWIEERRLTPADPPDFFQTLIETRLSDGRPLSNELATHIILLLVWAGHETTAGHISWAMIDLLQHPAYLQEVRQENVGVMRGRDGLGMTWQEARELTKMEAALKETERLHPVAFVIARKAAQDIELQGYGITKGTMLFVAPCVTHRLPEVFAEPDSYKPQRFMPGNGNPGAETHSLIGFGGGLHRCAGVNFARLEMKVVLAMLLQRYDFELVDEPRPISGAGTQWPASPCRVRYRRRESRKRTMAEPLLQASETVSQPESGCPFHDIQ